ncbi:MAG: hypothetical protein WKF37_08850 [Bryobacteraceae bacterium]
MVSGDYQLPSERVGRFWATSTASNAFIGGWQINGLDIAIPTNPNFQPVNQAGSTATSTADEQWQAGNLHDRRQSSPDRSMVRSSSHCHGAIRVGNSREHSQRAAAGRANVDASIFKVFSVLPERRLDAQFRLEAFNVLNKAQFGRVNSTIGTAATGNITSIAVPPRQLQLALKLIF